MLQSKVRLVISVEGTPLAVRLVPHKTDSKKLALKATHPEAAGALLQLGGLKPGEAVRGNNFFVTIVDRKEFMLTLPTILGKILDANGQLEPAHPMLQLPEPTSDYEEPADDDDMTVVG
jgi:hypothetical protein